MNRHFSFSKKHTVLRLHTFHTFHIADSQWFDESAFCGNVENLWSFWSPETGLSNFVEKCGRLWQHIRMTNLLIFNIVEYVETVEENVC